MQVFLESFLLGRRTAIKTPGPRKTFRGEDSPAPEWKTRDLR
jgi:hypothetical protein